MKKIFVAVVAAFFALMFPLAASAHSKMTASVPAADSVADSPVTEIFLEFNTSIEPVSSLTVKNESGEEITVQDVQVSGATLTGKLAAPLPNGAYTVEWKIIGADGHAVNGSYAFSVNVPQPAEQAAETPAASEAPAPSAAEPEPSAASSAPVSAPVAATAAEAQAGSDAGSSAGASQNTGIYWIGAAVIVLVAVIIVALRMGKKRT